MYEVDALACSVCGGRMKMIAFIEPPQGEVIEKILRHCGLWWCAAPRAPPAGDGSVREVEGNSSNSPTTSSDEAGELTYVDIDTFLATFKHHRRLSARGRCARGAGSTPSLRPDQPATSPNKLPTGPRPPLDSPVPPGRLSPIGGNQISYQPIGYQLLAG